MRPLKELTGQRLAVELLERSKNNQKIAPAYLFVGQKVSVKPLVLECLHECY